MRRPSRAGGRGATALVLVFDVLMFGTTVSTPLYPLYERQLGFGEQTTTIVFATYAAGQIIATLGFGSWSDQLGRTPLLAAAIALSATSAAVHLLPGRPRMALHRPSPVGPVGRSGHRRRDPDARRALPVWRTAATVLAAAVNMGGLGVGVLSSGFLAQWAPDPKGTDARPRPGRCAVLDDRTSEQAGAATLPMS